jgi:hypothetical protein
MLDAIDDPEQVVLYPIIIPCRYPVAMAAIASIWAWLMMVGGMRAYLDRQLSPGFAFALILSGVIALPFLFSRKTGLLRSIAPSGLVRAGLAVTIVAVAVAGHIQEFLALISRST